MKKLYILATLFCLLQAGNKLQAQTCNTTLTVASGDSIQTVCFGESIIAITFLTDATAFNTSGLPDGINVDLTGGLLSIFGKPTITGNFGYFIHLTGGCTDTITGRIIVNALPTAVVSLTGPASICQGQSSAISINFTGTAPWFGTLQNNDPFEVAVNPFLLTVTPSSSTIYRVVTLTDATGCASTADELTGNASVTVNPIPAAPAVTSVVNYCQGATASPLNAAGSNLLWYTTLTGGGGTATAPVPSTTTAGTTAYFVSQTTNGCESPRAVINVTVNATPVINTISDTAFCNGTFVSNGIAFTSVPAGAVFTWTNSNTNIGLGSSGNGNIPPFIASNINSVADSAIITVSALSSTGNCPSSADKVFKIKILAGPSFTSRRDTSICDSALFSYTATSSAVGTTFKWQRILPAGVTGLPPGTDTSTAIVNDRLDNTTAVPLTVKYVFRLSTGSACVITDTLKVVVYPTPVLNEIGARTYCNNEFVNGGISFTSNSPGTVIGWQIIAALPIADSLLGLPGRSGSGSIPPFVAKNNTGSDQTITIRVSISVNNSICTGAFKDFNITVRPGPLFTSRRDTSICDNASFSFTATSSAAGTTFKWQRILPAGVTGLATGTDTSTATVNDRLDNTTAVPLIVKYVFRLSTGAACVTTDTLKVVVYPTPQLNEIGARTYCNNEFVNGGIPFTSSSPNTVIGWQIMAALPIQDSLLGLPGSSGSGGIPPFVAKNNTGGDQTITIRVSISVNNSICTGAFKDFNITVRPGPSFTSRRDTSICDNASFSYTATSSAAGTTFKWQRILPAGVTGLPLSTDTSTATVNDRLNNSTAIPLIAKYVFRLITGSACVVTDTLKIVVYPTPQLNEIGARTYCNNEFVNGGIPFTSNSPDTVIGWQIIAVLPIADSLLGLPGRSGNGSIPPFVAKNNTGSDQTISIRVSISVNNSICTGSFKDFTITVRPGPSFTSRRDTSICDSALFSYTATSSAAGTTFIWERILPAGVTGLPLGTGTSTAIVNDRLDNGTDLPLVVKYVFQLSTGSACVTTDSLKVVVYPTPQLTEIGARTYCNNEFVNGGILFTSTSPDTVIGWQIIAALPIEDSLLGLPGRSGSGSIPPFVAKNKTDSNQTIKIRVYISVNNSICTGSFKDFTITVRPGPLFTSRRDTSVCDNALFSYTATSSAVGTTFKWQRILPAGVTGLTLNTDTSTINDRLDNSTDTSIAVKYIFTLTTGSGDGCVTVDSLNVIVNPTPVIDTIRDTIFCAGAFVGDGISFTSKSSPNVIFTWQNNNTGIGLTSSAGTGSIPPFVPVNSTTDTAFATITVSATTANGICAGAGNRIFKIKVLPVAIFTSRKDTAICNNASFTYVATSSAAVTSFKWIRVLPTGVTGLTHGTDMFTAIVTDSLNNSTAAPLIAKYIFTLTTGNGCDTSQTLNITVNPTPEIDKAAIHRYSFCNGISVDSIVFKSTTPDVSFTWTCDTSIGFGRSGNGQIPSFTAINNGTDSIFATVTVKVSVGGNNCPGRDTSFTITIYPTPKFIGPGIASVCDTAQFNYSAISSVGNSNTIFNWQRNLPATTITGSPTGNAGNTANIVDILYNAGSQPGLVKYYFKLTTAIGGCVNTDSLLLTVNPTPVIDATVIHPYSFCNGVSVDSIIFRSNSPNASFKWTSDTTIGFGKSGNGNIPAFTATNNGTDSIVATVRVSITASSDNCPGRDTSFTITVKPSPRQPDFTWLDLNNGALCSGTENINFNVTSPLAGIAYLWTSVPLNNLNVRIRDTNDANTVISFLQPGTETIRVIATNTAHGGCTDTVSHIVNVNAAGGITERKIIAKQPGNLLIYPDNSLDTLKGYQWGYDSVIVKNASFGPPIPVQGQVYQFFVPEDRFIINGVLDTISRSFWVLLRQGNCYTKVYYNGPYSWGRPVITLPEDNTVQLKVAPNPNNGIFDIVLKGNIYGNIDAKIYNSMGQLVITKNFVKTRPNVMERLETYKLPNGLYYLLLNSGDLKKAVARFVIQH